MLCHGGASRPSRIMEPGSVLIEKPTLPTLTAETSALSNFGVCRTMAFNFTGPAGETVFHDRVDACLTPAAVQEIRDQVIADMDHFPHVPDHRVLILVGGLLVENALDQLLAAIIPGYSALQENKDFSFSMKIALGRSLRLCPSRLFGAADTVRRIRNEIAHNLATTTFDQISADLRNSMRGHVQQFDNEQNLEIPHHEMYFICCSQITTAFRFYTRHLSRLNVFLRSPALMPAFTAFCQENP
jgi:hypothetical protein